jgi:hypothetical protein
VLSDVTPTALEAGFRFPLAVTAALMTALETIPQQYSHEDIEGRLWDVLWMASLAARRAKPECSRLYRVISRHVNPRLLLEQLEETMASTERLHVLLQSILAERDRFAAHLYQSRREYRRASETAGKSGKRVERCIISTFRIAKKLGFRGDFRQWEHLLQIGE